MRFDYLINPAICAIWCGTTIHSVTAGLRVRRAWARAGCSRLCWVSTSSSLRVNLAGISLVIGAGGLVVVAAYGAGRTRSFTRPLALAATEQAECAASRTDAQTQ